ncbi:hypothetical protein [Pontiella sp.]|uniref:hypothetical protein n=1 Tax=Pontiella sp. TaxID=2837462 RepID=UPI003565AA8D
MTTPRTIASYALAAIFVAAILGYSFCQPFQPDAVCAAIPERATFVFKAKNLDELLKSPVYSQLEKALGAGNPLAAPQGANRWIKLAAASEIAIADIPFRSSGRTKSWAAASWVGWRSPWLRWQLEQSRNPNLKPLGKHAAWPIWQYDAPNLAHGMSLTFALTDNLLLACLSESPSDILLLINTYDKRSPAHPKEPQP